jgi:hypothetical protein
MISKSPNQQDKAKPGKIVNQVIEVDANNEERSQDLKHRYVIRGIIISSAILRISLMEVM